MISSRHGPANTGSLPTEVWRAFILEVLRHKALMPHRKGEPLFSVVLPEDSDRRARAITALFEDRSGTLWCGTMKGLYRLDRANGHFMLRPVDVGIRNEYPEQALISGMVEEQQSSLWIATPSGHYRHSPAGAF